MKLGNYPWLTKFLAFNTIDMDGVVVDVPGGYNWINTTINLWNISICPVVEVPGLDPPQTVLN